MTTTSQQRVNEVIALTARGQRVFDFSNIDLSEVKVSSLRLFYKAVNENVLTLLQCQKMIVDEITDRE